VVVAGTKRCPRSQSPIGTIPPRHRHRFALTSNVHHHGF
jgi:hypothetical protein